MTKTILSNSTSQRSWTVLLQNSLAVYLLQYSLAVHLGYGFFLWAIFGVWCTFSAHGCPLVLRLFGKGILCTGLASTLLDNQLSLCLWSVLAICCGLYTQLFILGPIYILSWLLQFYYNSWNWVMLVFYFTPFQHCFNYCRWLEFPYEFL